MQAGSAYGWLLGLLWLLVFAVGASAEEPLRKVRLIPQWVPQAQFAGYYVAQEKGIYARAGLDVEILTGGPQHPPVEFLLSSQAEFATTFLADAMVRRAGGAEIVDVAQLGQRSALMLVARRSSGILAPQDLNHKKVGLWGSEFQVQPRAFFKRFNLEVEVVPQSVTVNLFLRGGVDAASAMWHNEYHALLNSGLNPEELTVFFFHEYGLNFPEDGLYCTEDLLRREPEMVCRFVRASLEGWRYAFAHSEEALDTVKRKIAAANVPTNRVHQEWMLARMRDIFLPEPDSVLDGRLKEGDYRRMAGELESAGLIAEAPAYRDIYRSCAAHAEK